VVKEQVDKQTGDQMTMLLLPYQAKHTSKQLLKNFAPDSSPTFGIFSIRDFTVIIAEFPVCDNCGKPAFVLNGWMETHNAMLNVLSIGWRHFGA